MDQELDLQAVEPENSSPPVIAGIYCFICLPIFLFCISVFEESPHSFWFDLFLSAPIQLMFAFVILHRSPWRREFSRAKRILLMALMSTCIYCINLCVLVAS